MIISIYESLIKYLLIFCWVKCSFSLIFSNGGGGPVFPGLFLRPTSIFQRRVTRTEFNLLSLRVKNLEEEFEEMQESLEILQEAVSNIRPKCPSSASGAVLVGNLCFSLERLNEDYNGAKSQCFLKGGMLAEPHYDDDDFYSRLVAALPGETNTVSQDIYVQIVGSSVSGSRSYIYESNGVPIPLTDDRWENTPDPETGKAAAIKPSGSSWLLAEHEQDETLPYLCQFDTVI
ncbi:UNVERIFIED_CONTAM: hypothetical protein RMT77_000380 [Armadillidium vulgare]